MENYKKMYFGLFNAVSDAIIAIEEQNYGTAKRILVQAQLAAEELYLSGENNEANILILPAKDISQRGNFRENEQQGI